MHSSRQKEILLQLVLIISKSVYLYQYLHQYRCQYIHEYLYEECNDYFRHIGFDNMVNHMILCNVIKMENGLIIIVKVDSGNPNSSHNNFINFIILEIVYPLICSPAFPNSYL